MTDPATPDKKPRLLPLQKDIVEHDAVFDPTRQYRYALTRAWNLSRPTVAFIGLNPSKADEKYDDPTVRKCITYARSWGYGGMVMLNLFAFRATDPKEMLSYPGPVVGDDTDRQILLHTERRVIVVCWGNHGGHRGRSGHVVEMLRSHGRNLYCLKETDQGEPYHPLYLPGNLTPQLWWTPSGKQMP